MKELVEKLIKLKKTSPKDCVNVRISSGLIF